MEILNNYWIAQTITFLVIFFLAVFVSVDKKKDNGPLPKETSNELRGLAILGVLFAHLTYGRFYDTQFLFPVGIWGGVAVDLFLFLSGYGLAASAIYHSKSIVEFYKKRLPKIYWPMWLSLGLFLLLDALVLNRYYPTFEIIQALAGFFPVADLWQSINSPLWFLTPLLFYYLLFPLIFKSKHPIISTLGIFLVSGLAFWPGLPVSEQIAKFYQLHCLAFPFGVLLASLLVSPEEVCRLCGRKDKCWVWRVAKSIKSWFKKTEEKKILAKLLINLKNLATYWRLLIVLGLSVVAVWLAYNSGVGHGVWQEQLVSLLTMVCLIAVFIFKKTKFRLLEIIGIYSFEIYLLHWPILGRYDIFYNFLSPAWGTIVYIISVTILALAFHYLTNFKLKKASS